MGRRKDPYGGGTRRCAYATWRLRYRGPVEQIGALVTSDPLTDQLHSLWRNSGKSWAGSRSFDRRFIGTAPLFKFIGKVLGDQQGNQRGQAEAKFQMSGDAPWSG